MNFAPVRIVVVAAASALAATRGTVAPTPRVPTALFGCLRLGASDSVLSLSDVKALVSGAAWAESRTEIKAPTIPADSVQFYGVDAVCDTIADRYRAIRVTMGDSNYVAPVFVFRLGNSGKFAASARVLRDARDYIIVDSTFDILGMVDMR